MVALIRKRTIRDGLANFGGGILNIGVLTLFRCHVENNVSEHDGGGIGNVGDLEILQSTIRLNTAMYGGGIANEGTARLSESLLADNHADEDGGGIYNSGSFNGSRHLYAINTTLSANLANNNGGGTFSDYDNSLTYFYNTTLAGNGADDDHDENGGVGGGIYAQPGARFVLVNALLANNTQTVFTDNDCFGAMETYGRNDSGIAAGCSSNNGGTLYHVTPLSIWLLQDNGGPTMTNALLFGSEAVDSALTSLGCVDDNGAHLDADQRGALRPSVNRFCDAGAFEFGAVAPLYYVIFRNGFDVGG